MRRFSFRLLFICVFMPPICYILTLQMLEGYFQKRETSKLSQLLIKNHEALYEGRYTIKEEINRNIGQYLSQSLKYSLGVRTDILVKTTDDLILYPVQLRKGFKDSRTGDSLSGSPPESLNYVEVAAENYRILNKGLALSVDVQIKHNGWLSNSILVFYVFLSVLILQRFIKKGIREAEREETDQKNLIQRLSGQLKQAESKLKEVGTKEEDFIKKIAELKKDKRDLSKDVDGLLKETEELEAGLRDQRSLKEETEFEVLQLREELDQFKGRLQKPKKKKKKNEATSKRFKVLYKNLVFTERAIEGFLSLNDEFQLKAEEIVHKLNEGEDQVPIKRKVFGKGGKMNILEVDFSYSGRIYFQKDNQPKTRILAIGTKNTQEKDLAFIESVR